MPTLVTTYGNPAIDTTSPKTTSVTTAIGDVLVCYAGTGNSTELVSTPTGGTGLTWTLKQSITGVASRATVYLWTATATTAETFTFSITTSNGARFSYAVARLSGATGIGASASTTTTLASGTDARLSLTTTGASSSIVYFGDDWNAVDGTTRTWDTSAGAATETTYNRNSAVCTMYGACYANVGAAGAKTIGVSAPTGQAPAMAAVEITGGSSPADTAVQYASGTPTQVAGTWTNPTSATGAANSTGGTANTTGTTPNNCAFWSSSARSVTATLELAGYNFQSAVQSSTSTINSVTATIYHAESATASPLTSATAQLFSGATAIGTAQTLTLATVYSASGAAISSWGALPTYAQLADLRVQVTYTRANSPTASTTYIDAVGVKVNYTPVATPVTVTGPVATAAVAAPAGAVTVPSVNVAGATGSVAVAAPAGVVSTDSLAGMAGWVGRWVASDLTGTLTSGTTVPNATWVSRYGLKDTANNPFPLNIGAGATTGPTFLSSGNISTKPVVRFNGTNQALGKGTCPEVGNHTWSMVVYPSAPTTGTQQLFHEDNVFLETVTGTLTATNGTASIAASSTLSAAAHLVTFSVDTTTTVYVDGAQVATGNAGFAGTYGTDITIGVDFTSGGWFAGDIAEIAFWDHPLTNSELTTWRSYVTTTYGIATGGSLTSRWTGAVTPDGATVGIKTSGVSSARLKVATDSGLTANVAFSTAATPDAQGYAKLAITGLAAATQYYYGVEVDGVVNATLTGKFKTFPAASTATSFNLAFGSCCDSPNAAAFSSITARNPDLFVHLGDLKYLDAATNDVTLFRGMFDEALATTNQGALLANTPTAYIWSDHDFGTNNCDATAVSAPAAASAYRQIVPSYPLASGDSQGIYQTFTYGRVRFIMTDLRSYRSADAATDNSSKTMLGATQKTWLKNTITNATESLIIWCSEVPWTGTAAVDTDLDDWSGFDTERQEMASYITASKKNVVIIAGDAHMLGADNGTNSPAHIPVHQGAPFYMTAELKGTPYSAGTYPTTNDGLTYQQYGWMAVTDTGSTITVAFTGYDTGGTARITQTTKFATVAGVTATAAVVAPAGTVTGGAVVAGPVATAGATAPAGSVAAIRTVTLAGVTAATAAAAPAGAVATAVTLTGVPAAVAAAAPAGTVSGTAVLTAPSSAATTAAAPAGTVAAIRTVTVTGVVATATASAPVGAVSTTVTLAGVTAAATATAPAGSVATVRAVTLAGVTATATAVGTAGSVVTGGGTAVIGVTARASATAPAGAVAIDYPWVGAEPWNPTDPWPGPDSGNSAVTGVTAAVTATAPAGAVSVAKSVTGPVAATTVAAPAGTVAHGSTLAGPVATATAAAPAGGVSAGGSIAVSGPVAASTVAAPAGAVAATRQVAVLGPVANAAALAQAGNVQAGVALAGAVARVTVTAPTGFIGALGTPSHIFGTAVLADNGLRTAVLANNGLRTVVLADSGLRTGTVAANNGIAVIHET